MGKRERANGEGRPYFDSLLRHRAPVVIDRAFLLPLSTLILPPGPL